MAFCMVWYGHYDVVQYGMVGYGMVWQGVLWYRVVWYGMVWYGINVVWYQCGMVSNYKTVYLELSFQYL